MALSRAIPVFAFSLRSLSFLFDKGLDKALEIVHNSCVKRVVAQGSGREIFQVKAHSSSSRRQSKGWPRQHRRSLEVQDRTVGAGEYMVLPYHYCSCHAFQFEVINRGEAFLVSPAFFRIFFRGDRFNLLRRSR